MAARRRARPQWRFIGTSPEKEDELYQKWCKAEGEDPSADESRDRYNEEKAEIDDVWESASKDDVDGHTDNMNKD